MTDPHDPWAELANSLGAAPEPQQPPPLPAQLPSEPAPRSRGRRRSADAEGGEAPPRRRRREPKPAADAPVDPFLVGLDAELPGEPAGEAGDGSEPLGPDGEPRKRRRRRGRRKGAPAEAGAVPEGVAAPVEVAEDDGEEVDLAPIETYSSLNIPTWQQLIDGLYKP